MPRKPKPIHILEIQGLSFGERLDLAPMVDDFTGEVIPRVWPQPQSVPPSAQSVIDAANAQRHRQNQLLLQAGGIIPKGVPAGVHAFTTPARKRLVVTLKPKDWRRI